jgi:hypothetical protein
MILVLYYRGIQPFSNVILLLSRILRHESIYGTIINKRVFHQQERLDKHWNFCLYLTAPFHEDVRWIQVYLHTILTLAINGMVVSATLPPGKEPWCQLDAPAKS